MFLHMREFWEKDFVIVYKIYFCHHIYSDFGLLLQMDKVSDNVTDSYDWRNERQDAPYRRKLKQKIKLFLLNRSAQKQRRQLFIKNLTPIAHQVERYLYSTASSLDEYCDEETLDMRMMKIVELISKPRRQCKI